MTVRIKRVYNPRSSQDGVRVLVDRLWPRGLTKEEAALDVWMKDIAPSNDLRKWYHAHPVQWLKFREKYLGELTTDRAQSALQQLHELEQKKGGVTLLYASRDVGQNHALLLKQLLEGQRKPPTGTGPARTAAAGRARAARRR
jgi:uncharacterized protein YeaO (DUF488 family)